MCKVCSTPFLLYPCAHLRCHHSDVVSFTTVSYDSRLADVVDGGILLRPYRSIDLAAKHAESENRAQLLEVALRALPGGATRLDMMSYV